MPVRSLLMAALLASFSFLATARACDVSWLHSPPFTRTAETTDAEAADHLAMLRAWLPPVKFDGVVPSPAVRPVRP